MTVLPKQLSELPDRKETAFDVTVRLIGRPATFRCIGGLQENTCGRWRLDLAWPVDPLPVEMVGLKQIKALCDSLTDELAAVLKCPVTTVVDPC